MTADPLELLCERCGVVAEFTEASGAHRVVSRATRQAILLAMGALTPGEDPAAALERHRRRDWLDTLPPVVVVDEHTQPYRITLSIPAPQAETSHRWVLACENGRRFDGTLVPATLEAVPGEADGAERRRCHFRWESRLPPGYHQFTLEGPAGTAITPLIVTPHSCYVPPALESGGRVWGPALQLYAVRSERNWGIGDFTDLRNVVELGGRAGAGIVGLNPLHELKPGRPADASPYGPSSRLYLNYLYLDVEAVAESGQCEQAHAQVHTPEFQSRLRALRAPELVDYPGVAAAKREVLELLYADFRERHLPGPTAHGREFLVYLEQQGDSLRIDSLYCTLSEYFEQKDPPLYGWRAWPEEFRRPDSPGVEAFYRERRERVEFFAWLQWHCELQIAASGRRSMELGLGVGLYEDFAISVDRDGGDAWRWQALLALDADVGAPPDALNLRGQNWGLPPFVPDRLHFAAYGPYIEMLRRIMRPAGGLRIDHVMGLMRLYWVPAGMEATDGGYVHYPFEALIGILALESQRNRCLVVGEDLGTVPPALRDTLARHGVLSTRVMYFEKHADGGFHAPAEYPAQAVATITTHDLPTLKGWWAGHDIDTRTELDLYPSEAARTAQIVERSEDRARLLVSLEREELLPAGTGVHPVSAPELTTELMAAVHGFLARSPARVLTVQPEDVFGSVEQVNVPGTSG
jgi:(1->4)-alpha-D-glucan 1-alpha-D-glucosylmutase